MDANQTAKVAMDTVRDMSGANSTANQMAEKTRQIREDLDAAMDRANLTADRLAAAGRDDEDELHQVANIVLPLQRGLANCRG
jgi:hypothetical protein